ncbi:hypothetical protein MFOOBP_25365 [Escherichia coli]|nr:hypothetical protein MFOOBP_25365 [Escherichia coli]
MRLKWKNGCAENICLTLPIFARGTWMKPTWSMAAGRICTGPSTARPAPFYLSSRRNSKLHTGFWVKSSTT